ncbi:D-glycero-beta-D-manno-heptose-7-phosphate kinase [Candidatus Endomicrobiellum devescovinae]|jgi:D-beta-D-heptose 7-phosphate kinase/D-beta-D-heptose 1-phosphate adenosyltransferase|uniref:D-glycero-beta-D-manno-heptose-7-phosphate kinase n=1 Tax=Candidatus Endomicrobiellum devescovinae TaxID=3242322 RepID=UPI00282BBA1A|nr:D-glycero-beta-D-manno-heptose-7-phosphate kinase [Endomicrobium sp.]
MELLKLISLFKKQTVLVVGDTMVDKFIWGKVVRISPEAPVPVVEVTKETEVLGGAANVANNITALGGKAFIVSAIGEDITGKTLIEMLSEKNINYDYLVYSSHRPTIIKTRIIAASQQVVRVDKEVKGIFERSTELKIIKNIEETIPKANAVIISDYGKGVVSPIVLKKTIALARKYKIPVTVDPKIDLFKKYKKITTMTPNEKEAIEGMGLKNIKTDKDIAVLGKKILKTLGSNSVVITRGEKGMTLIEPNNKITNIPTRAKEVYDVTGAGDTVISTMTLALAAKADLLSAAEIANFAAGIVVGKLGTATTNPQELEEVVKDFYNK